jgi:hypothetical protein
MNTSFETKDNKDEWLTPPYITDALGPFDMDSCRPIDPPWMIAPFGFTILDDGLKQKWTGFVWCNPPYGRETPKWLAKMAEHRNGLALCGVIRRTAGKLRNGLLRWPNTEMDWLCVV